MSESRLRNKAGGSLSALGEAVSNAVCACIIAYCVVSFFAGQAGLLAYRDMKSSIAQMNERLTVLGERNAALSDLRSALTSNSDRMVREARDIGYLRQNEKMVIFSAGTAGTGEDEALRDIEPLRAGSSTGLPDRMIKILAAMTGLAVLFASLLMTSLPKHQHKLNESADRA
ncbi:MAG: septum formation initiator family protein [Rectinemataceae bacterium]|nr:septum formation initiator family protein [Rectinemataceae bacterium]